MKRIFIALTAASVWTGLAIATVELPSGTVHQDGWGNAVVHNQCQDSVYYVLDNTGKRNSIKPSATISVPVYTKAADGGGGSIKLFLDEHLDLYAKPLRACTQFEFTPAPDQLYVDVSNVNSNIGDGKNGNGEDCEDYPPFMKHGLKFAVPDLGEDLICAPGVNPCKSAYSKNKDDWATVPAPHGKDVDLFLCHGGSSSDSDSAGADTHGSDTQGSDTKGSDTKGSDTQGSNAQSSQVQQVQPQQTPTAAPDNHQTQAQPSQTADDDNDEVVFTQTHLVQAPAKTEVKYVYQNADAQKEKRQEHVHHHIHNKIHKRRHGA